MKLLNLYVFSTLVSKTRSSSIPTKKICRDCRHFIGDNIECRKFGDTNIITGKVTHHSARSAREDEKKCGQEAVLFEKNHFKILTEPYYFLKDNWILLLPSGLACFYFYALCYIINK